jgi:hypothetical protein
VVNSYFFYAGILGKSKPPSQGNVKAFDLNFGKGCGSGGTSVDLELNARAGVDWKALIIPACLPITTDFVPKKDDLEKEFFINEYSVYPYDYWETSGSLKTGPLTVYHVFETLVSQVNSRIRRTISNINITNSKSN